MDRLCSYSYKFPGFPCVFALAPGLKRLGKAFCCTLSPDIAAIFGELSEDALPLLFRLLPKELAADAFVEMDADRQESLITRFSDTELKAVIDELYIDDAVDLVEEMPANVVKRILKQADPDTRKLITIADAIRVIRREGLEKETINDCFVTNADRTLAGIISLRTLILSKDEDLVGDRMDTNVISVTTMEDQESVAEKFKKYDLTAMPVVDGENRLVGIVTVDDAIDVMEEEATEVWDIYKHRIPWLMLLMVSATFTGLIITKFEHALAAQVVLTAYIPMLMDTGGNSGSQSSVTIIRGLSLSEIHFKDIFAVLWKEIRVAVLCGLSLAVVNFAKLLLLDRVGAQVALVVSLTLVVTVVAAKFIGCTLPLLAKKIGFDPAVMASPLITTIVDALALLTYFGIASSLLHI